MSEKAPDIKIFVSHRIDQDSETIDNPLYIPVRCGAVFDKREGITMLGDDTGDNISEKRGSFCELTVQYWAWKNVDADYYGLCHYRRYLSFNPKHFPTDMQALIHEEKLGPSSAQQYQLLDSTRMAEIIRNCDGIFAEDFDLKIYPFPDVNRNVFQYWKELDNLFIDYSYLDTMLKIAKEKYPEYSSTINAYMKGQRFLGYNCFILKRELFYDLCQFEFSILFELEKKINTDYYSERMMRSLGYFSEILYSIWIFHKEQEGRWNFARHQLVMFDNTDIEFNLTDNVSAIPLVIMSSKSYAAFSAPFLQSIIENLANSLYKYEIVVLHHEILESDQKKLISMFRGYNNLKITFYNPNGILDTKSFYVAEHYYAVEAYYRLFCPWILQQYSKVIILDVDIIVTSDLKDLFATDLDGMLAAGVKDVLWQGIINRHKNMMEYSQKVLKLSNPYNYINTGVLLLNLDGMRKKYRFGDVVRLAKNNTFKYQEQDVLNVLLEGNIKFLDYSWNYYVPVNPDMIAGLEASPAATFEAYTNARSEAKILHFAAQPKPWLAPEIECGEVYWKYARETPFYEALLGRLIDAKATFLISSNNNYIFSANQASTESNPHFNVRKIANKLLPKGSYRRKLVKLILPRDSLRWRFSKCIYNYFESKILLLKR